MTAPPFEARLLHPRYWPTWFGLGLVWLLSWLPIRLQMTLGEGLGWLAGQLARNRRRIVLINLALCFPELSDRERARRANRHFRDLGAGVFETGLAWFAPDWRLRRLGQVSGIEHLQAAQAGGRGALLLTGHFTTLEIGARFLCLAGIPFHAMYRPYNNAVMDWCMHRLRELRSKRPALPRADLRRLVRALRDGGAIWYAPDQALDRKISVYAPFFGTPVLSITATARLAQMGRAAVVPYFPAREGGRYHVRILPALTSFPDADDLVSATRVNRVLEDGVRLAPSQYFWVHKRFKRVPEGVRNPYRRK